MTVKKDPEALLLVQAKQAVRRSTAALLEKSGIRTVEADDGFDALCKLGRVCPKTVLMDLYSPRLDGYQVCALIRSSKLFRRIRVVLLADNDSLLDRTRAELAGADVFLVKPYQQSELLAAVQNRTTQP